MVWIDMLPGDNAASAAESAKRFQDPRLRHFHDPNRLAGRVLAKSIGAAGHTAWDMYLFYGKEAEWIAGPPSPVDWVHQLDDEWAGSDHHAWGDGLKPKLRKLLEAIL